MKIPETNSSHVLITYFLQLFRQNIESEAVRSIAVSRGKITLKTGLQLNLFEDVERTLNQEQLDITVDKIRQRYGFKSLMHASSLLTGATGLKRSEMVGGHRG